MAISINEELLTFTEATKILPKRRRGRKVATSTLYRWAKRGLRGVRLEVTQVGGTMCTSRAALRRFFNRLTVAAQREVQTSRQDPFGTSDAAEQQLDQAGF